MALNLTLSDAAAAAMAQAFVDHLDSGAGAGRLRLYDGSQPGTPDDAITTQTLLAELTFSEPSEASITAGVIVFDTITSGIGLADASATWFRIINGDGDGVLDGTVGVTPGSFDLVVNTTVIVTGAAVTASSLQIAVLQS